MNRIDKMLMRKFKKIQLAILTALMDLGGTGTTREIATMTGFHINGVSQSLGAMGEEYVNELGGTKGDTQWKLVTT